MHAAGTFTVAAFDPTDLTPTPAIETAVAVGVSTMTKQFTGEVDGRSATLFTAAFDQASGVGTYLAMESFEGRLGDRAGTVNFAHSATTLGDGGRAGDYFVIVPGSGTGDLAGITGSGGLTVDPDGTHRVWFDYDLPA